MTHPLNPVQVNVTVQGFDMTAYVARYDAEDNYVEITSVLCEGQDLVAVWDFLPPSHRQSIEVAVKRVLSS